MVVPFENEFRGHMSSHDIDSVYVWSTFGVFIGVYAGEDCESLSCLVQEIYDDRAVHFFAEEGQFYRLLVSGSSSYEAGDIVVTVTTVRPTTGWCIGSGLDVEHPNLWDFYRDRTVQLQKPTQIAPMHYPLTHFLTKLNKVRRLCRSFASLSVAVLGMTAKNCFTRCNSKKLPVFRLL